MLACHAGSAVVRDYGNHHCTSVTNSHPAQRRMPCVRLIEPLANAASRFRIPR
jgi:hypothetical protein